MSMHALGRLVPGLVVVLLAGLLAALTPAASAVEAGTSRSAAALPAAPGAAARVTRLRLTVPVRRTAAGRGLRARVVATYADGRRRDVTRQASYRTSSARVATAARGTIRTRASGSTAVRARFGGKGSNGVRIRVTRAVPTSIDVRPGRAEVPVGGAVDLTATTTLSDGRRRPAKAAWSSSAPRVASVAAGTVTGNAPGSATVTAREAGLSDSTAITVSRDTPPDPEPTGLVVSPDTLELVEGGRGTLTATVSYDDGTSSPVSDTARWSSADPAVVTVAGGEVRAVGSGTATVTAQAAGRRGTATITVVPAADPDPDPDPDPEPTALVVDPDAVEVAAGATTSLTAGVTFDDGSTSPVTDTATWTSSDTTVATVDGGEVTALTPGTTTVTASAEGRSGTATVTVVADTGPDPLPTGLRVDPVMLDLPVGGTDELTATLTFDDDSTTPATDTASWSTSDPAVVTVASGEVTATGPGTATVAAEAEGQRGTATVTVTAPDDRMEQALSEGEPDVVTRAELVAEARRLLGARESGADLLPASTPITWDPTRDSFRADSLAAGYQVPLLRGNTTTYGSPPRRTLAAYGSSPTSAAPLAFFALDPFAVKDTGPQTDPGMNQVLRNVLTRMLGEAPGVSGAKVTLANIRTAFEPQTRQWLTAEMPDAEVTATNNACDFPVPEACLAGTDLLVVGGDNIRDPSLGSSTAERNAAAAGLLRAAHDSGVPVIFFGDSFDSPSPVPAFGQAFGMTVGTQYFGVSALAGATRQQQLADGLDQVGDDYAEILDRTTSRPPAYGDYAACVKPAGGNGDLQGWTWARCASQPAGTADGVQPFLDGLTRLRTTLQSATAPEPFTARRTEDGDLLGTLLLLADKARTGAAPSQRPDEDAEAVTYPVALDAPREVARSVFADYVTTTLWDGNQAAEDPGTLYCSRPDLLAGTCAEPTTVDVGEHALTATATTRDEWKATGISQVPGAPATYTLAEDPGFPVHVRTFYARTQTTRGTELDSTGVSRYDRPQFAATQWVRLLPGEPVTTSSSYGGPVYLRMAGTPDTLGTEVSVAVEGVGTHPTLLDASDGGQVADFVDAMRSEPRAYYADLSAGVVEVHTAAATLERSLAPYTQASRRVDYGGLDGLDEFVTDFREAFVYADYGLAGLKTPGRSLEETVPAEVQTVCDSLGIPCLDEQLNVRPEIQHASYDPQSSCGNLCAGNPLDSDGFPRATGYGENHELGHNLQRDKLDVHWVDTAEGAQRGRTGSWANYVQRSVEVSNNIFPSYALTRYFRAIDDDLPLTNNNGGVNAFSLTQSLRSGVTRGGRLVALQPNGAACTTVDSFPPGTPVDAALADTFWSDATYTAEGDVRLNFYLQVALLADGMEMADGTTLATGWDLYTLLYGTARQFTRASASQAAWEAERETLGFGGLPFAGDATYGGGDVGEMPGNDFLLVQLNRITGHDWSDVLASWGVWTTPLAQQQARDNAPEGGYAELGDVRRVLDRQLPHASLSDPRTPLLELRSDATRWPGFDNNGDGDTADAGEHAGFHPVGCP